jgi:hypothetical protein
MSTLRDNNISEVERRHTRSTQPPPPSIQVIQPCPTPRRPNRLRQSLLPENVSTQQESYGHFPSAPEFYPVDPPDPTYHQNHAPEHLIQPSFPPEGTNPTSSQPLSAPVPVTTAQKRPAVSSGQPAAKRTKKSNKKAPATSLNETLRGIGPIGPREPSPTPVQPETAPEYGSLIHRKDKERKIVNSPLWKFIFPLKSNERPGASYIYSLDDVPVLEVKPPSLFVGCRLCCEPSDNGTAPEYV